MNNLLGAGVLAVTLVTALVVFARDTGAANNQLATVTLIAASNTNAVAALAKEAGETRRTQTRTLAILEGMAKQLDRVVDRVGVEHNRASPNGVTPTGDRRANE